VSHPEGVLSFVTLEKVAGSSPVGHPPHDLADRRLNVTERERACGVQRPGGLAPEPMAAVTSTLADTPYGPRTCSMVGKSPRATSFDNIVTR
jgi:hypothetical protein